MGSDFSRETFSLARRNPSLAVKVPGTSGYKTLKHIFGFSFLKIVRYDIEHSLMLGKQIDSQEFLWDTGFNKLEKCPIQQMHSLWTDTLL